MARPHRLKLVLHTISRYITGYKLEAVIASTSQTRALKNYRKRLTHRGMARFEVLGLSKDRDLIRSLARRLAEDSPEAHEIRTSMHQRFLAESPSKGGILAALRRSPLVGIDLKLSRPRINGRKVNL